MGMIINIDEALKLRTDYNVLKEPLHAMMKDQQEAWEKKNPIDLLFNRGSISSFQETYTSSIGFAHAFTETSDAAVGPIFNTAEGFSATYTTRTFQGGFVITQQALEDRQVGKIKDDATAFVRRWHADIVEYCMTAILGGFTSAGVEWTGGDGKKTVIKLQSADTTTGAIDGVKNTLFCTSHKTVAHDDVAAVSQSNLYAPSVALTIGGSDAGQISKLADLINQVITIMENYKDDNGKYAGVDGAKTIVCENDPHLKGAIETALSTDVFCRGEAKEINPAYKRATLEYTPYLNDVMNKLVTASGGTTKVPGFFIVDKAYMAANHGLELTERVPFTLDVTQEKRPFLIAYDGRQRFDVNCASWRGICYVSLNPTVYLGTTALSPTQVTLIDTINKPVTVVGTVTTQAAT